MHFKIKVNMISSSSFEFMCSLHKLTNAQCSMLFPSHNVECMDSRRSGHDL